MGHCKVKYQPLHFAASLVVEAALGALAGLGRWCFVEVAVLPVCGDFKRRRQHSATTAHRALPVCGWSALGMLLGTIRSNEASDVCSRFGGACTGGCGRGAVQVARGGCGFAGLGSFAKEEAALINC